MSRRIGFGRDFKMRRIFIKLSWSGVSGQKPEFQVVTAKIGGSDYMFLRLNDPDNNKDYMVSKYSIAEDRLTV